MSSWKFLYFCCICGLPCERDDVLEHYGDLYGAEYMEISQKIEWLNTLIVIGCKPPFPIKLPSEETDLAGPNRTFETTVPVRMVAHPNSGDNGRQLHFTKRTRYSARVETFGVYDFTEEPFPGVLFPMHLECNRILHDRMRHLMVQRYGLEPERANSDDIHEVLSMDWETQSPESLDGANTYGRTKMDYEHGFYGVAQFCGTNEFDHEEGWEWVALDPSIDMEHKGSKEEYDTEMSAFMDRLPKIEERAPDTVTQSSTPSRAAADPFNKLPAEIIALIVSHIFNPINLRALQQASPRVAQLHISNNVYQQIFLGQGIFPELAVVHDSRWERKVDWKAVLDAFEGNRFEVFGGIPRLRNRARIFKLAQDLADRICGPAREARERGDAPRGPDTWCEFYYKDRNDAMYLSKNEDTS